MFSLDRTVWLGVVIDLGFKILQSNAAALDEVQKQKTDDVDIMIRVCLFHQSRLWQQPHVPSVLAKTPETTE